MKHIHILIKSTSITRWILINQIIIKGSSSTYYYPDILNKHPFEEGVLLLPDDCEVAKTIAEVFKKYPPHKISLFKMNDSPEQLALFKDFRDSLNKSTALPFFTVDETKHITMLHTALRLTESQKILLKKACVSAKLRHTDTNALIRLLEPYTTVQVKNKAERKCVFNELNDKLWR